MSKLFNLSAVEAFEKLPLQLRNFFTRYPPSPFRQYASEQTLANAPDANPFIPNRHPVTGKVQEPVYSLRRQSDLYKLAYKFGVADLMPTLRNNKKFYAEKFETKPLLKGVLSPKGHKWERTYDERKKRIADAVAKAEEVIVEAKGSKYKKRIERKVSERKTWF
ncbi:hypothetical protein KL918_000904 [Ogataea parapolymorpha]|uniref:Mitochondrial 54S ribosomal protein YmL25 n=1 Tax=Ogataea parapolymorpha (strain ATCC 26012 / BCRC 20466 / JCM 22074 / NRRL Y-7560 / DL-1) TaxID=871575 RepID=W1QC65_OGAPD|nr:mitochondrial 54S ribosomal protein YmL25 [Ogataea parapolymorpha DL-1]ESW97297.1 mitochondrial 54S ribosomal protein YmL25 [Ogataea parapolymorpha DL-1]KAG7869359.1 hypothetical protein KL918_000904 [Ogataea parapolymorpha]KAG7875589.1 hypothetical protein KL916_000260 [Ogataea parapolymorpha]